MKTRNILIAISILLILIFIINFVLPFEKQNVHINNTSNNSNINYPSSNSSLYENLTVYFIDVGQGDSILITYANKSILMDAGEREMGTKVEEYLRLKNISTIDYVIATHPHSDHIGGLPIILNRFKVNNFIDSGYPHTSNTYQTMLRTVDKNNIPYHIAQRGEFINFDKNITVEILNPTINYSKNINENSIILKITNDQVSFLFMSDAGIPTENSLLQDNYDVNANILKIGHHGSYSSSGTKFLKSVSPEICIIEVGADNEYGLPHKEVLEKLQKTSKIYRTDYNGTIMVTTDGKYYTIEKD